MMTTKDSIKAIELAHKRGDDVVLRSLVIEVLESIKREPPRNRPRILMGILGGLLFATGVQGFLNELNGAKKSVSLTVYVVIAMIGLSLVIMSTQR
jgi:hypothetical protein